MAAPIGPGDWVECVRDSSAYGFRVGQIYLCIDCPDRVLPCSVCGASHEGITLKDAPSPRPVTWLWPTCCFRPIYRPKTDFIESLKAPPQRARETEAA